MCAIALAPTMGEPKPMQSTSRRARMICALARTIIASRFGVMLYNRHPVRMRAPPRSISCVRWLTSLSVSHKHARPANVVVRPS